LKFGAYLLPDPAAPAGLSSIASLETALGRKLDYDVHYSSIDEPYPGADLIDDAVNGRTPIVSLGCGTYTNASIAAGTYDAAIDLMANALRTYGNTVLVRYLWEMNAPMSANNRTACAGPDDTNGYFNPTDFVAAWDHLRARFILDGATNVKWYWCPGDSNDTLAPYFPSSAQVDYLGVDVYDRPQYTYPQFAAHVQATYASIENLAPGMPFIVGETGATTSPGQMTFFSSLNALYATMPNVVAWAYFDAIGPQGDWRVQPATAQFAAYKSAVTP
jgi:beta-mannanase